MDNYAKFNVKNEIHEQKINDINRKVSDEK